MKKKKIMMPFILGTSVLSIVSIASACTTKTQAKDSELAEIVNSIKKLNKTKKTIMSFSEISIPKEYPIRDIDRIKEVLGINMENVPESVTIKAWKPRNAQAITFNIEYEGNKETVQANIRHFQPRTEYENKLLDVFKEIKKINQSFLNENILRMKSGIVDTGYKTSDDIGEALDKIGTFDFFIRISPELKQKLVELEGYKRIVIEKDYDSVVPKIRFFANLNHFGDIYDFETQSPLISFSKEPEDIDEKAKILKTMLEVSKDKIRSTLSDVSLKKITIGGADINNSLAKANDIAHLKRTENAKSDANAHLVMSKSIIDYMNKSNLTISLWKEVDKNNIFFNIKEKQEKGKPQGNVIATASFEVKGRYWEYTKSAELDITGMKITKFKDTNYTYIFNYGSLGWLNYLIVDNNKVSKELHKRIFSEAFSDGEKVTNILFDGNTYFIGGGTSKDNVGKIVKGTIYKKILSDDIKTIELPKSNVNLSPFIAQSIMPSSDNNKVLVILKTAQDPEYYYIFADKNAETLKDAQPIAFEVYNGVVEDMVHRANNKEGGYLFSVSYNDGSSKIVFQDRNMQINTTDWMEPEFQWKVTKIIPVSDGGYWLLGEEGKWVYIDSQGKVVKSSARDFYDTNLYSATIVNNILYAGCSEGLLKKFRIDPVTHSTKLIWEDKVLNGQDIKFMEHDEQGYLYLSSTPPSSSNCITQRLTPDGLYDAMS